MSKRRYYNFDSFRVDPTERVLLRDGKPLSLSPKVFDTLLALVERSGHIVSKNELVDIVWPDVFVEENNLTQYVATARRALGDNRQAQRYIETVPKRGYRFAPSVRLITEDSDSLWQAQADYSARTGSTDVGLAESYALAGDHEKAYHWLERAFQDHEFAFAYTIADPLFVDLRVDERFNRLAHYKSAQAIASERAGRNQ